MNNPTAYQHQSQQNNYLPGTFPPYPCKEKSVTLQKQVFESGSLKPIRGFSLLDSILEISVSGSFAQILIKLFTGKDFNGLR
jgi:hypothetical protein